MGGSGRATRAMPTSESPDMGPQIVRGRLGGEGVHFGEDCGGFGFEGFALAVVVVFGVFAGFEFEVEVAEVFVDDVAALAEVVEACFLDGRSGLGLGPEDVGSAG